MPLFKPAGSKNYYFRFRINKVLHQKSTHTSSQSKALKIERKAYAEAEAHLRFGEDKPITLKDAIDGYIKFKKYDASNVGWSSLYRVIGETKSKAEYCFDGDTLVHTITSVDLTSLVHSRMDEELSARTIKHEIGYLKRCLEHVSSLGYKTPTDVKWPKIAINNTRIRFLTTNEVRQLISDLQQSQNPDNADLVIMLLDTACRHSEATSLPWSAIDWNRKTISLYRSKVNNTSVIPMTDRLHKVLLARYESKVNRFVFPSADGLGAKIYNPSWFNLAAERIGLNTPEKIEEYGSAASIHTLRHTAASRMAQNGLSLQAIGVVLGHSPNSSSTTIYAHLVPSDTFEQAIALLNQMNDE